jgi:hypothetical protein
MRSLSGALNPFRNKANNYKIGIWCFSAKVAAFIRRKCRRVLHKFVNLISTLVICLKFVFIEMLRHVGTRLCIRSCLLHELTASQLVAIVTHSDTGSHNNCKLRQVKQCWERSNYGEFLKVKNVWFMYTMYYRQQCTSTLRIWKVCLHSNMYA